MEQRLAPEEVDAHGYQWQGEAKQQIAAVLSAFLERIWLAWGQHVEKDQAKALTFQKVLFLSCLLLLNEDPSSLISRFSNFFGQAASPKLLRQLYTLILCLCFYS